MLYFRACRSAGSSQRCSEVEKRCSTTVPRAEGVAEPCVHEVLSLREKCHWMWTGGRIEEAAVPGETEEEKEEGVGPRNRIMPAISYGARNNDIE